MKFFGNSNNYSFKACVESNLDYGTIIRYFTGQYIENF